MTAPVRSSALRPATVKKDASGARVACFGKGFGWRHQHYLDFNQGAKHLTPLMNYFGLEELIVPDLRGGFGKYFDVHTDPDLLLVYSKHHRTIYKPAPRVDAVLVNRPIAMITKDCPTLVLTDTRSKMRFVVHIGRDTLATIERDSVINTVCRRMWPANPKEVVASIWCGIGAQSFENHTEDRHRDLVSHFVHQYGKKVLVGDPNKGRLDIPKIATAQLQNWGIPEKNISWDGVDTYRDKRFHSLRRQNTLPKNHKDRGLNNCVLVF